MTVDVSVIIVNYNTLKMTSECIDSVIEKTQGISYEIILVDNGSNDGSKEHFEQDARIKYIYSEENLGFGRANNLGVAASNGNKVFFLNPDTILINNPIKILSDYLDNNISCGAVGGNLYDGNLKPCLSHKKYLPGLFWEVNNLTFAFLEKVVYKGNQIFNHTKNPMKVGYITGADLMMWRSLFVNVGGFDPDFFLYYEETDLCLRIKKNKYDIQNVPNAKIQHLEGASFNGTTINKNRIKQTEIGRKTYYTKHFKGLKRQFLNGLYVVNLKLKSMIHLNTYRKKYSKEQLFQFKAIWSGK